MTNTIEQLKSGLLAYQQGHPYQAEVIYREVLARDPNNPHGLNLLGMLCVNTDRADEAVPLLLKAYQANPQDHQACANLGLAYKNLGDLVHAAEYLKRSVLSLPNPNVFNNLGNVLRESAKPQAAIKAFEQALSLQSTFAECWSNMAAALRDDHQLAPALRAVDRGLQLNANMPQAHCTRAEILFKQARFDEALSAFDQSLALNPKLPVALLGKGRVLREMGQPAAAASAFEQVLEQSPSDPEALYLLGLVNEQAGRMVDAERFYRAAIAACPTMGQAQYQLSQLKGAHCTDTDIENIQAAVDAEQSSEKDRYHLHFALYRAFEKKGLTERAWGHLTRANAIMARTAPYDNVVVQRAMTGFSHYAEKMLPQSFAGCDDERPVFVLGMPRSGTSLTEQILACHSMVGAVGEVSYGFDLALQTQALTGKAFPESMASLTGAQLHTLGLTYLSRFDRRYDGARVLVDKTPLNFQYIGLLAMALPEAKFIHCHRNPVANCFSIFRLPFDASQPYAHELTALARYYRHYSELMQRWKVLFPDRILDVCYEDTVADLESQALRMLEFLGLPFENQVLNFYDSSRVVRSPSAVQVRQPIYRDALSKWQLYRQQLSPLISLLDA